MMALIIQLLRQGWQPLRELWQEGGMDEILFANRNKSYGAYELRRNEGWYLLTALGIVLGGLVSLSWISTKMTIAKPEASYTIKTLKFCKGFEQAILPPPPCPSPHKYHKVTWQRPVPAPLAEIESERLSLSDIPEPSPKGGVFRIPEPECGEIRIDTAELPTLTDWIIPEIDEEEDIPEVYQEEILDKSSFLIDPMEPKPINLGELLKLIQYPQIALDAGIQGAVVFHVLIGKDGHYKRHQVIEGHPVLVREIEKHLPSLRFTPVLQGDKPINYWVNIPFNIKPLEQTP